MTMYNKKCYMGTPFHYPKDYQYILPPIDLIPKEVIDKYGLMDILHDGYMYIEFRKKIIGFPKLVILPTNNWKNSLQCMDNPPDARPPAIRVRYFSCLCGRYLTTNFP